MAHGFLAVRRDEVFLLPPDMRDWLAEDHLAWFVIDVVDRLDLASLRAAYRLGGQGRAAHDPAMMLALLLYAYSQGERSSRRIERACEHDVAYRVIAGGEVPDHTTIARFRQTHEAAIVGLFVQVLALCAEAGLVRLGVVAIDGTKLRANAALSNNRSRAGLEREARRLLAEAAAADAEDDAAFGDARGDELPASGAGRAGRRQLLDDALARLGERSGRVNLTDRDSRIMVGPTGGFLQGFNAQVAVADDGVIVAAVATDHENDQRLIGPMIDAAADNLAAAGVDEELGVVVADAGYLAHDALAAVGNDGPEIVIAPGAAHPGELEAVEAYDAEQQALDDQRAAEQQRRLDAYRQHAAGMLGITAVAVLLGIDKATAIYGFRRWTATGEVPVQRRRVAGKPPSPALRARAAMRAKLKDNDLAAAYRRRAPLAEGAIAGLKHRLGFRRVSRRGLAAVDSELRLVAIVHNILKLRTTS